MKVKTSYYFYYLILTFFVLTPSFAQTSEQKALEAKRERLQQEIKEINRLLFAERKEKGTILDQMEALDNKINVRQELIRVTNQQSNLLNRQINVNIRNISKLREDLDALKEDYAELIQKTYQNKSQSNRVMFLLSAENFYQAFKRLQYMQQYAKHRKKQGENIITKTEELAKLNQDLVVQRKEKEQLLAENTRAKNELSKEVEAQRSLLRSVKQNEAKYTAAINEKQKEARKIDREIERLIKSAIASSNKSSGKSTSSTTFALTPEAKLVADNFSSNKGRLIWPVEKGIKSQGYGVYADKLYPGIKHQNNGVTITTDKGSKARAIFEGEVIAIISVPGGSKGVTIKHGNYISTYYNLSTLYVKKGDKVVAKDLLGDINTDRFDGTTKLKFYLYKDSSRLNPEDWIYQL
ncbi:Septal ring factor EnvC, activator of murein hydrolases AmiA and AmiB [Flagellimonas taeanensis]|uniref:Septal ring factor EnvC, activator of murein hydrolases AmiA and AmiB n=1 Tax=Flagellimonas taeanensis TaxID=1005926 RepID=A0A1M6QGK4_9FLAO|nr:peptidoglycan DD-metalloendopeptidase family protein [Allomuricauda taeanensis]SFB70764.1 Septal ring factor EnvC, activator of murein hydrolases AmiA and AmiB [Allomuricauda taeanensis]SHK19362.1 Septal ring factor EnvC, activator of murein hydrolases AmiA and AmiB [Allomuricauda taeanensis]